MDLNYDAMEALLRAQKETLIHPGCRLDRRFFEWCRTSEFGVVAIQSLFFKGKDSKAQYYDCELKCGQCGEWFTRTAPKSDVFDAISACKGGKVSFRQLCNPCLEAEKAERERPRDAATVNREYLQRLEKEWRERSRQPTEAFIAQYLSIEFHWNPEVQKNTWFQSMVTSVPIDDYMHRRQLDDELVAAAIKAMPIETFSKTPYWKAVEEEIKMRVEEKCSVCTASGPFTIRHRTMKFYGYEHTEQGLREILCLCERCNNNSLLKVPAPSSKN